LPPDPDTTIGFTPDLLILDEASRIPDALYNAASPMLAYNDPTLILLSTPAGRRGFFYREWTCGDPLWQRFHARASECSRISPTFLAREKATKSDIFFRQEYECEFIDSLGAFFPESLLDSAIDPTFDPLLPNFANLHAFPRQTVQRDFFGAVDLGFSLDYSAFCVLEKLKLTGLTMDPVRRAYPQYWEYRLRHMERLPLQTPYKEVVRYIADYMQNLKSGVGVKSTQLVVDASAMGLPVVEMFREADPRLPLVPVVITGGDFPSMSNGTHKVPKRDLMNRLHIALEEKTIRIPRMLPTLDSFREEFIGFQLSFTDKGNDVYEGRPHDDMVVALALAAWKAA
jgi:hypothetical protein